MRWVLVGVSLSLAALLAPRAQALWQPLALSTPGAVDAAFYVSTTGNDSHAGTLAAPFATLAKCQTAMQASSGAKLTCYIRGGTYTPGTISGGYGNLMIDLTSSD